MRLSQIHDIYIIADTGLVWRVIIVSENLQLFTDTHSRLGDEGDQVHGHAIGQFTNECCGMGADGVEVAQDDTLDRCAGVDIVLYDFLVDLFGVTIRRHCLLNGGILRYGQILL